jgi:hypothetical protein
MQSLDSPVEIAALNKRKEHPAQPYGDKDSSDKEETHKSKKEKREEIKAKKEEKKEEHKAKKEEHKSKKDSEPSSSGKQVCILGGGLLQVDAGPL